MARRFKTPQHESLIEALSHVPNPMALAAQMRPGGGVHRTDRGRTRFERRTDRNDCRQLERGV